jgi:sugar (pentulose or hexulose) kinase
MAIVLGVDIGTTSAKCLAVDEDGAVCGFAQAPYGLAHPHEGWAEQDPEDYVRALADVVRHCVADVNAGSRRGQPVAAMALSTQADTLIVCDETGTPLLPALTWMDTRAADEHRSLLSEREASLWYRLLGQPLTPYSSLCKLLWLRRHESEIMARRPRLAYVPDFLAHRLTGRWVTDMPSASWSPFLRPVDRNRAREVLDLLAIDESQIAEPLESGVPIGKLTPDLAGLLGLQSGTIVRAGAFDQTAAACGAGAEAKGAGVLSCGTAWVLYSVTRRPPADTPEGLCVCCHANADEWGLVLPFTGGSAYDWVTGTVATGSRATDSSPLVFIPHLYGGLSPDWNDASKGTLLGLTLSHSAEDIRLALMRGMAFETRRNIEAAAPYAGRPQTLRMVGGATHSDIWPQIIADALNCCVEVASVAEAACYGAAMLAAGDTAQNWKTPAPARVCVPDPAVRNAMEDMYAEYGEAYALVSTHYARQASRSRADRTGGSRVTS